MSGKVPAPKPFWKGHGLWRFPNFLHSVRLDSPQLGLKTASTLHYRRLTIEAAVRQLPSIRPKPECTDLPVYFMTGREHWAMTAFCAFSLLKSAAVQVPIAIMDDGTLCEEMRNELRRILQRVEFLAVDDAEERVCRHLPPDRFPALHAMRRELPLMRKLMDLHAGNEGWRLFLDSDVLFFRNPEWMLSWLKRPSAAVFMNDYQNSYGYPASLIEEILGQPMPEMINTGLCGLRSEAIDWDRMAHWARRLHAASGTNHFSEQCLTAMLLATSNAAAAPVEYLIHPTENESRKPTAVMHHYVAESRTWYHIYGWPGVSRGANS